MSVTRELRSLGPWILLLLAIIVVLLSVPPTVRTTVLNAVTLLGMAFLAVPAIRVNEQGRLIERVKSLQAGIETIEAMLESRSEAPEARTRQEATLETRRKTLEDVLKELTQGKGAWTPWVHRALYGGYVLLFGAAMGRIVPEGWGLL